ncbi:MAG: IS1595 family transposase [Erysipelotrichaceae bacterium]|nr:IS1595 family transposase [Erysipelotrichaceae bacterium]
MAKTNLKPKKDSLVKFTRKYANDHQACLDYFINMKYPTGFYCEKCGCVHYYYIKRHNVLKCKECGHHNYLFAGTIFQDNKMDLYTLLLGLYLFFSSNKGISATELRSELDVNYKTALLLCRKCRILMAKSNSEKILDSMFYEADTVYIGAKSKEEKHQGCGTEQQPFLAILTTAQENNIPLFIKLHVIPVDNSDFMNKIISKSVKLSPERTLNTDGKTTFYSLKDQINLQSEKINYEDKNHKLFWLNTIVANIQNNIVGIYRGIAKRDLPLFLNEQQWRFNHRNIGPNIMNKVAKYIVNSSPHPRRSIVTALNIAEPYFNPLCN